MKVTRSYLNKLKAQLKLERQSFEPQWRELSDYILPTRSRFFIHDVNRGDKRNNKIIDSTATFAVDTLRAGMMSGITSPARDWFKLALKEKGRSKGIAVKRWLDDVEEVMRYHFVVSNLYNVLPNVYADLGVFSTGCVLMEADEEVGLRFYSLPIGSYSIGNDDNQKPRMFMREFKMTVRQIVLKFAKKDENGEVVSWDNISNSVKNCYQNDQLETWVTINHAIIPNPDQNSKSPLSVHKKFLSCYYEESEDKQDTFLRKKGFDFFPVLCPRWEVTGEDVYGTSGPAMRALGDIKQLQFGEKKVAHAINKMIDPPMVGPTSLRNSKASILAGDITYLDDRDGRGGFREAHQVRFDIGAMEAKQAQIRSRINKSFYADLFLMLANSDRRNITAREIDERHEEKLLALGPVLEQLNQDLLDPLIDNAFQILFEQGKIPLSPEEIEGLELKIEYVSIMAQAQKLTGIASIDRFMSSAATAANFDQSVIKKVNIPKYLDRVGEILGVPSDLIRSDEEVQEMNAIEAQAQQQAQQAQQEQQMIQNAKTLSETSMEGNNALAALTGANEGGQ